MKGYSNPFELIYEDKHQAYAMHLKSCIVISLVKKIKESGMTQANVAAILGVSQPRVSHLFNGRLDKFSIDMLILFSRKLDMRSAFTLNGSSFTFTIGE